MIIKVTSSDSNEERIPFYAKGGTLFFNCTKEYIDKAVENKKGRNSHMESGERTEDPE